MAHRAAASARLATRSLPRTRRRPRRRLRPRPALREVPDAGRPRVREALRHVGRRDGRPVVGAKSAAGSPADPARGRRRCRGSSWSALGCGRPDPGGPAAGRRRRGAPGRRPGGRPARLSVAVSLGTGEPEEAQAVAEGALLGSYRYAPISSEPEPDAEIGSLTVVHPPRASLGRDRGSGRAVARAVVSAREWVNIPANLLYPESFADQVRRPVAGHPDHRRRARRQGADARRLRRPAGRRRRLVPAAATGPARYRPRGAPRRTWRWSARASRSTPVG